MRKIFSILFALALVLSLSLVTAVPAAAAADTWYVDPTGTDDGTHGTGPGTDAFATIQYAIDDARVVADDTINVADGTYTITSAITVDKGLTITGNTGSPENVVVTYASPSQTLDCLEMQANDITAQGIKVVNGRYGFNFATSDPTGCTISHCVIDHCYEGAINIDGGSGHTISDSTITSCLTSGTKRGVIHIYGCPNTIIDGNTLTDNGLTGYHATMGIYVKYTYPSSSSERVEVINNNISGMLGINADIQVYDAPYTYIYNNTISNSEDKGIAVFGIYGNPAYTSTANRVEVIGNTISSTYYPGVQAANAPYTYFYNNTLTQCNYYGGDGTGDFDYASIHIDSGSAHCLIDSNTVSDGINGIQLWSDSCTITNNTIYDMGKTYADTKVTGDGTYHNSAILYGDMYNVWMPTSATISFNNIYDNYWGLFVISTYTGTVTAEKNWWGAADGPSHSPGSGDSVSDNVDYSPWLAAVPGTSPMTWGTDDSIQDAIDAASPGDTVNVAAGTYAEKIDIYKQLTIEAASSPIIDGTGLPDPSGPAVHITADNVRFQGFIIRNFTCTPTLGIGAIWIEGGDGAVIDNNEIYSITSTEAEPAGIGIDVHASDVEVTNNEIHDVGSIGIRVRHDWNTPPTTSNNILLEDNTVYHTGNSGVLITGYAKGVTVRGNEIYESLEPTPYNLFVHYGASDITIEGNYIHGTYANIVLAGCDDVTIEDNTIESATPLPSNASVKGKNIYILNDYGSWYDVNALSTNVEITGNDILNADGWGVRIRNVGAADPTLMATTTIINFNSIVGNTEYGVENGIATDVDAEKNWWGSSSGPYHATLNPGGTGDAVSDYVDFEPWLVVTVTTQAATAITKDSATMNMDYTVGDYSSVQVRFAYKKAADATWTETSWVSKSASGSHAVAVTGLDPGTLYDFKAQLKYDTAVIEGDELQFSTQALVIPTVETQAATDVSMVSATLNTNYTIGDYSPVQVRFTYKESADAEWSYTDWVSREADGTHAEELGYPDLSPNTEYDFKAQLKYDDFVSGETVIEGATLHFATTFTGTPGCFIATAAYGTPTDVRIDVLREFRDVVLLESAAGSRFVTWYYQTSPPIAEFIAGNEPLRTLVRVLLVDPMVWVVEATGDMWRN